MQLSSLAGASWPLVGAGTGRKGWEARSLHVRLHEWRPWRCRLRFDAIVSAFTSVFSISSHFPNVRLPPAFFLLRRAQASALRLPPRLSPTSACFECSSQECNCSSRVRPRLTLLDFCVTLIRREPGSHLAARARAPPSVRALPPWLRPRPSSQLSHSLTSRASLHASARLCAPPKSPTTRLHAHVHAPRPRAR